jgi:NADH-quinone oxidoreductase subunit L
MLIAILLLAPLLGFFINGIRFRSANALVAGTISTMAAAISFLAAILLALQMSADSATITAHFFSWIEIGKLNAPATFVVDRISLVMILIVTGVGSLIHLFSVGYMSHDERPAKYFAYLNFFLFNMLMLVTADNLLLMFVGWEGVGLCSYLLIGFWFTSEEKAAAGLKAFVTNRIGDAGFLLGIFMLFILYGTVNFAEILTLVPTTPTLLWSSPVTLACLLLFIGATGKSAQIPLYVWLPDAMAGPTPVSALIHAATMVTAGIYMIVRLSGLFLAAPLVLHLIAIIGALTALLAASIALTQWDIKKILAYSTVSQLGYMFMACGVGAFGAGFFHLITHAFFKSLLFLGAGAVIHALHDEQDIRKMGGLQKSLPTTYWCFAAGWLAILGLPPFAGFFSKDEILWQALKSPLGHPLLWFVGVVTAAFTSFYMTRLMALTFWGKPRSQLTPHQSSLSMTVPLVILAILSLVGGWIGIPHVLGVGSGPLLTNWLAPAVKFGGFSGESMAISELGAMLFSVIVALASAWLALDFYLFHPQRPVQLAQKFSRSYNLIFNKYFVDEFYKKAFIQPTVDIGKSLWAYVDLNFIDRLGSGAAEAVSEVGSAARTFQNGNMQQYALYIALGVAGILFFVMR